MPSAGKYTAWKSEGKHSMLPSQMCIFCLSSIFFRRFFPSTCACFAVTRCPPLSSFAPWTNSSMSDGFSLHHASLHFLPFHNTFGGEKNQAMSRRILKPSLHAGKTQLWTFMNSWHAFKVDYSDHCKHLCFLMFLPCCASSLQHHGQLPTV